MPKYAFTLLLLISINYFFSQKENFVQYNTCIKQALNAKENKDYKLAQQSFDAAFLQINFIPYDYFYAFQAAINDSNFQKGTNYLIQGTLVGLNSDSWFTTETNIYFSKNEGKNFRKYKDSLLKIHFQQIDTFYYNELLNLKKVDQAIRSQTSNDSLIYFQDSLNFEKLIDLSKHYGFPSFKFTGYGFHFANLILWHQRDRYPNSKQWIEILPYINTQIKLGYVNPNMFLMFDEFIKK
jgi:hypothetical protein